MQKVVKKVENKIYSVNSASKLLGVSKPAFYNLVKSGQIKVLQIIEGGRYRIRPEELKRYLKLKNSN